MSAWPQSTLGEHVEVLSGFAFPSERFNTEEGMPLIRIRDVVRGVTQTKFRGEFEANYLVRDGDTLIGMDGQFNVGTWAGGSALLNQRVCRIKVKPSLDSRYLFHFLPKALKQIEDATSFVTVKHLSVNDIRAIRFPLPPQPEQRRIAAILDQAEALRAKRRQALAKLDTLTQSLFLEMFEPEKGKATWPTVPLADLIKEGPQNGLYRPSSDYGDGTPILRIDAFYDGEITGIDSLKRLRLEASDIERYGLRENDLIINRVNSLAYLGKSALVPSLSEPTVFESNMMRFTLDPSRADPVYAIAALQTSSVQAQIQSRAKNAVNQSSINQADVRSLKIQLPPMSLQLRFKGCAASIRTQFQKSTSAIAKTESLFAALQELAFGGAL